uniref:Uncharacterized protein n=1 Tax=Nelumbo nucifera TaxID=4432 RepID=A0A822XP43_NELNU|nr:TPA_asm: hypothetical protein HUJ06_022926 [Nelumbo nucifera]
MVHQPNELKRKITTVGIDVLRHS